MAAHEETDMTISGLPVLVFHTPINGAEWDAAVDALESGQAYAIAEFRDGAPHDVTFRTDCARVLSWARMDEATDTERLAFEIAKRVREPGDFNRDALIAENRADYPPPREPAEPPNWYFHDR